jgi:Pentapeptide repeats (9 copies)
VVAASQIVDWDDETEERAPKEAATGVLRVSRVRLSPQQLERLLGAIPRQPEDPQRVELKSADFEWTTFTGDVRFDGTVFIGNANFYGATFTGEPSRV